MKHVIRKKVFHRKEENLIRADRNLAMHLCVVHRAVVRSHAEARKANRKEARTPIGAVTSRRAKEKVILRGEKYLTQVSQLLKAGPKGIPTATGVVSLLKEKLLVSQVLKAAKGLRIENSAAVHRTIRDISHFVNQLTLHIINHHSEQNAARKISHCAQGRNLPKNLV